MGNIGFCRGLPLSPRNPGEGGGEGGKVALARVGALFSHPRRQYFPTLARATLWREWEMSRAGVGVPGIMKTSRSWKPPILARRGWESNKNKGPAA